MARKAGAGDGESCGPQLFCDGAERVNLVETPAYRN